MKLGVAYPQIELGAPEAVRSFGLALEAEGFDHVLAYDHVVGAEHADRDPPLLGPYTETDPFHDPLVMFAYLAGVTQRLEMATGILILPQRQTVLVAKQAVDLALFSGDRFRLGVGTGWNWVEYRALGADFARRGARLDEQVDLLRRLWSGEVVSHQGSVESVERATLVLKPRRPIPIWMGGFADPAFRRAAQVGDGFIFAGRPGPHPSHLERLDHFLQAAGRSDDAFGRELIVTAPKCDAQQMADALRRWRDAGHSHGCIDTMRRGFTSVEQHVEFALDVKRRLG